jgi:hypothetical protein
MVTVVAVEAQVLNSLAQVLRVAVTVAVLRPVHNSVWLR